MQECQVNKFFPGGSEIAVKQQAKKSEHTHTSKQKKIQEGLKIKKKLTGQSLYKN